MNLSCEQCRELLALHVDTDLPADVASHLQTCANCTREYNIEYSMLRAGVLELRALPPMPAPANLRERVRAQIAQEIADANETSQKKSRIAPRFALPRFTMPRPMIPRWATYALPPFAVTACLLLLLSREPNTTMFSDVRDAPETSAPAANTLDNENKTSSQKPPGKRAPQTAKTRAQNESSTRSANQSLRNSNNSKNARDAQTQNAEAQNAEAQNAATDADSPPAVEPQVAQAPQVKSNIPTEVAPRNSGKDSRSAAQSRVAPVLPSAKPPTSAPRLFARLETDQSSRSVSREYSKSSTTDGASTNVAPPSTQVAPVIAPPTSSKNADGDLSSDTSSRDTSLDASGNDENRNDANRNDENRARIKSSNTREPENSADSALLDNALENELRAGSSAPASSSAPAQSAPAQSAPQSSSGESTFSHRSSARTAKSNEPKTGVTKPSVAPMPAPVLPDEFASGGASNGASSDASSSMMSNRAASPNTAAQKTPPAKSPTSSTRSDRKTRLLLTLPKTSASLRVQIRWPNGATQTVWNGRGVRGQKLKIEVSPPRRLGQNATRNKNARAQVSVQEAAPIPNSSRASWKTIAREEITIQ